jgi:carboxynorspermidine decarboxylase
MLPTQSGGPGAFVDFDLSRVPTPCYVVDEQKIRANLAVLRDIGDRSGAKILLALKAFSMWSLAGLVDEYLDGCCASGLWEARLAREKGFLGARKSQVLSTFSPAYRPSEFNEICSLSDHVIFNRPSADGVEQARVAGVSSGLRINPEISLGLDPKYDPCAVNSRLGYPLSKVTETDLSSFDGLHMHTLCEQNFSPLLQTWIEVEHHLGSLLANFDWINLGGGHHCTRADYDRDGLVALIKEISAKYGCQVYLEPGEAVALDAGLLVGSVLDIMDTKKKHALLDLSATCHAPDVIEAPYRPALLDESDDGQHEYFLGGASCLTADSFGHYKFRQPLAQGDRLAFLDQAHYTMVKTNTFNGVCLPCIALWNSATDELKMIKEFDYQEFVRRLS